MWPAFIAGIAGGLLYCLPLSAVNVEIIRRGLADGFRTSLLVSLGAIVGDAVWLTLAVLGAETLLRVAWVRMLVGAVGATLLLYLAWAAWRSSRETQDLAAKPPIGPGRAFALGVVLCLASPFAVLVLLAVIQSLGAPYATGFAVRGALYAGILGGAVIYGFVAAGLSSWGRRFMTPRTLRFVDLVAALLFVALAGLLAWQTAAH